MEQDQDFSALRNLLALKRSDLPQDSQVDQFLIEFHNRQRAQLLVRQSFLARASVWLTERVPSFALAPSLSYASAFAAVAIVAFASLSQHVQVSDVGGQTKLSFRMPTHDTSFAMVPASFISASNVSPKLSDSSNFVSNRNDSAATRYVLATNSHGAYDATVAF